MRINLKTTNVIFAHFALKSKVREKKSAAGFLGVSASLLECLRLPLTLQWRTVLPHCGTVVLTADLYCSNGCEWPPRKVLLSLEGESQDSQSNHEPMTLSIPTTATPAQLEPMIEAGFLAYHARVQVEVAGEQPRRSSEEFGCIDAAGMPILDSDAVRGIIQPKSLQQWHHKVCGHLALYNASCLLRGKADAILDERLFWANAFKNVDYLVSHGIESGRWKPNAVTGGVADEVHLRQLVEQDIDLRGNVDVFGLRDVFIGQLREDNSSARRAIGDVKTGQKRAHCFILGATTHWYTLVVCNNVEAKGRPHIFICDSYNTPLARVKCEEDVARLTNEWNESSKPWLIESIKFRPEWQHRSDEAIEQAFLQGVPEWWKGGQKPPLFWQVRPMQLRKMLKQQEFRDLSDYLTEITNLIRDREIYQPASVL